MNNNGRIDIQTPSTMDLFNMHDKINLKTTSFRDALTGNWENTELSNTFFCKNNIGLLNNAIKKGIYDKSNGKYLIGPQNQNELKTVMRAIYLQNALNLNNNISQQILALNKLVLDYCIPHIFSELEGYIKYQQDVSTMYTPIDRPIYSTLKDKTLELKNWF